MTEFSSISVHIVFGTKGLRPHITDAVRGGLNEHIADVMRRRECGVIGINFVEDHAHMLINLSPAMSLDDAASAAKEASCEWLKNQDAAFADFAWQEGYGAFTVSACEINEVREYIANQREHHANVSFENEYRDLLKRNGVEYDERCFLD